MRHRLAQCMSQNKNKSKSAIALAMFAQLQATAKKLGLDTVPCVRL